MGGDRRCPIHTRIEDIIQGLLLGWNAEQGIEMVPGIGNCGCKMFLEKNIVRAQ